MVFTKSVYEKLGQRGMLENLKWLGFLLHLESWQISHREKEITENCQNKAIEVTEATSMLETTEVVCEFLCTKHEFL